MGDNDNRKLSWRFATKLEKVGKGGENYKFKCNYCSTVVVGYYTRVRAYLFKIKNCRIRMYKKVTQSDIIELLWVEKKAEI